MTLVEASIHSPPISASVWSESPRRRGGPLDYRDLTGYPASHANIDDDIDFDRHVLASILSVARIEGASAVERAGLSDIDLAALLRQHFPGSSALFAAWGSQPIAVEDEEVAMVRDLLLANRSSSGENGRWLAAMIARRAMEPNHLWEDLGLRARSELSRMLMRHFAPLALRNTRNMRWKRFFYRMLCEDDGLVMCTAPVCTQCPDFDLCFGDESGESRMADRRREFSLRSTEFASASAEQA